MGPEEGFHTTLPRAQSVNCKEAEDNGRADPAAKVARAKLIRELVSPLAPHLPETLTYSEEGDNELF